MAFPTPLRNPGPSLSNLPLLPLPFPSFISFIFLFFFSLYLAQVIVSRRESPGVFSSKHSAAVLRRAQRIEVNVTLRRLQLHLLAAPAPPVHQGVSRHSQILGWQGTLLCFQFTVRLNLQRLTRLIYFVADRARRAHKKPRIHSPLKQNTMESEGSRCSWVLHSGPRHTNGCVRIIRKQGTGHGLAALGLVPSPLNYRLELIQRAE